MPVRLALCDLGAPGWGEPWFPHSAVLLYPGVAMFVMAFLCFGVCVCLPPYPDRVDTMLSPLRSLLDVAELASQSHSLLVLLFFVLVACLCLFFVCVGFLFVCGCFACDGCWDYVSVHASSTFEAFFNCLRQCFN